MDYFFYTDRKGELTNSIPQIVEQEVTILCYQYVEEHGGEKPSLKQIQAMVSLSFDAMLKKTKKSKYL